ncbi:MAG: hypothetical protein CMP47_14640 [Rickettsiales bacterium]|nr:hypothetical protein [Rickettsiales bacterium]
MEDNFAFIDCTKSDRSTKKLVRSHAMKGKNAGKTHHRRSRLDLSRSHKSGQSALVQPLDRLNNQECRMGLLGLTYEAVGEQLLAIPFPIEATSQNRPIINQFFAVVVDALHPPELCRSLDVVKSYWLRLLFMDTTSYHCAIALLATLNNFFFGAQGVSSRAIYHLSQAVRLVNQQLQTAQALSNSNLTVVNFLIVHELLGESRLEAEIHLRGLHRMVMLRGGLMNLEDSEPSLLVLKICKTDLDFALNYGTSTCFYRDRMANVALTLATRGFFMNRTMGGLALRFNGLDPTLQQILVDLISIASLFNAGCRMDPHTLQEVVVSVGYRLIRFHPLCGPCLEDKLSSAFHIGLTSLLTTLFLRLGGRRFLRYSPVTERLKEVIESGLDEDDRDLMLWLLFIGRVSVLEGPDQDWIVPRIRQAVLSLGITSWAGVHRCILQFPWINALHDKAGKALWESVLGSDGCSQAD